MSEVVVASYFCHLVILKYVVAPCDLSLNLVTFLSVNELLDFIQLGIIDVVIKV